MRGYLDTASCGLPCPATVAAVRAHLDDWAAGTGGPVPFDGAVQRSRAAFARLAGVPVSWVSVGSQVSAYVGVLAASLPAGSRVLVAEGEFTSMVFPFLAQPGVTVETAPLERLADAVRPGTTWVAVSAVQSADGALADLPAVRSACTAVHSRLLVDATQSAGWLPLRAAEADLTVTGAYKWLGAPRGSAFATVSPEVLAELRPVLAGWYAGPDPLATCYGLPLRLADDARRLDVSPAWSAWAGTAPAVDHLLDLGIDRVHAHDVGLAAQLRAALGLPETGSAITSLAVGADVPDRLVAAGIRASSRAGRLRLGFHHHNDEDDLDRVLECLRGSASRAA